jgi:Domain of unknown function (DUF4440)
MSRLVRVVAMALVLSAVALPALASAAPQPGPQGKQLVRRFLNDLQRANRPDLRKFLSPAFQLQRADGSHQTKADVIKNPTKIRSYTLRGFQVTSDANVLVARFQLSVDETINGKPFKTAFAPRIAVFVSLAKGWQLIGYANFNTPQ